MRKATVIVGHKFTINNLNDNFVRIYKVDKMDDFSLKNCVHETIIEYHNFDSEEENLQWEVLEKMNNGEIDRYLDEYDMTMIVRIEE